MFLDRVAQGADHIFDLWIAAVISRCLQTPKIQIRKCLTDLIECLKLADLLHLTDHILDIFQIHLWSVRFHTIRSCRQKSVQISLDQKPDIVQKLPQPSILCHQFFLSQILGQIAGRQT